MLPALWKRLPVLKYSVLTLGCGVWVFGLVEQLYSSAATMKYLLMSLRLSEGSDIARFRALSGQDLPERKINELAGSGLLEIDEGRLKTTRTGRLLLNAILRELLVN